jgi:hypothetical protein
VRFTPTHRDLIARQLSSIAEALERCERDALSAHAKNPHRVARIDLLGEQARSDFERAERSILALLDAACVPPQSEAACVVLPFPSRKAR